MKAIRASLALFDWNETLLYDPDTWDAARSATFRKFGVEPPDKQTYHRTLAACNGDYVKTYEMLGIRRAQGTLNRVYNAAYIANLNLTRLSPGAETTLRRLASQKNLPCGIVSTQSKRPFLASWERFPAIHPFLKYVRYSIVDKSREILKLANLEGVSPENVFYVGDTASDIRAAKNAGAKAIAYAPSGIPEDSPLKNTKPDFVIGNLREILNIIEG